MRSRYPVPAQKVAAGAVEELGLRMATVCFADGHLGRVG